MQEGPRDEQAGQEAGLTMQPPGFRKYRDSLAARIIKRWEGCRLKPYLCSGGYWTIGYGHVCRDECGRMLTIRDPKPNLCLGSIGDADGLFQRDLPQYTIPVDEALSGLVSASQGVFPTAGQSAALVSFCFNLGEGNLLRSTLLKKVLRQDFEGAEKEFLKWRFAGGKPLRGLLLRRQAEARLFARGY